MGENTLSKNIIRLLAIILEVMCFVPVFLVSCNGEVTEVCMKTAITGHEEANIEPDMFYLLAFFIPVLIFIIWFFKNSIQDIIIRVIVLGLAGADIALWISFKNEIFEIADKEYCNIETTSAYTANYILLGFVCFVALVDICAILYRQRSGNNIRMEDVEKKVNDIQTSVKNIANTAGETVKMATNSVIGTIKGQSEGNNSEQKNEPNILLLQTIGQEGNSQQDQNVVREIQIVEYDGFCWQCGNKMIAGGNFCVHCGAKRE